MATDTETRQIAARSADRYIDLSSDVRELQAHTEESRNSALHRAAEIERKYKGKHIPDDEWAQLRNYVSVAERLDHQLQMLRSSEEAAETFARDAYAVAEGRAEFAGLDYHGNVKVKSEPATYGPGKDHSFYRDLVIANVPEAATDPNESRDAQARLDRYGKEQRAAKPDVAKRADLHTAHRATSSESRAMTSVSVSGGSFVTPIYDTPDYDVFRSYPDSVVNQVSQIQDPGYGLEVNVPVFTTAAEAAAQASENTGIEDFSASANYVTGILNTIAGEVPLSQQLYDRAGPDPVSQDKAISAALRDDLRATVDQYVITQMTAVAGVTTGQTSFTLADFWQDFASAASSVATGAGQKLPASHVFAAPDLLIWLLSQSDLSGRPLAVAVPTFGIAATLYGKEPGFSGFNILGAAAFSDGNIPNNDATHTPLILCNAAETFVLRSEPVLRVVVEALAPSLSVIVQLYQYVTAVVRHPTSVQLLEADYLLAAPSYS